MAHAAYVKAKALELRARGLTIDQLAEQLCLPRTTVFGWVRDIPIERTSFQTESQCRASRARSRLAARNRAAAEREGRCSFDLLCELDGFRDFVCLYIGEGHKRMRSTVGLANSNPRVIQLADRWMRALSGRKVSHHLQYHADQDVDELRFFWAGVVDVEPDAIRVQRKSNSGQLAGRSWRSRYGVLTVRTHDTLLRSEMQGWMDRVEESWIDSAASGRSSAW